MHITCDSCAPHDKRAGARPHTSRQPGSITVCMLHNGSSPAYTSHWLAAALRSNKTGSCFRSPSKQSTRSRHSNRGTEPAAQAFSILCRSEAPNYNPAQSSLGCVCATRTGAWGPRNKPTANFFYVSLVQGTLLPGGGYNRVLITGPLTLHWQPS